MKKISGAPSSFFTKAPTPTPVSSMIPEKDLMPKEIVQIDAAKTPSGLAIIDSVSRKESTNDDMEVDDVVVKKRGPLLTFFSYFTYLLTHSLTIRPRVTR